MNREDHCLPYPLENFEVHELRYLAELPKNQDKISSDHFKAIFRCIVGFKFYMPYFMW